jgi:hypothetical protein
MSDDPRQQPAVEIAAAHLEYAAHQFSTVYRLTQRGDTSQAQLQARRRALEAAALAYCAALGHAAAPS